MTSTWLTAVQDPETVFDHLGVRRVIHAGSTTTRYGNSQLSDDVWAAMRAAGQSFCDIDQLNCAVSEFIATVTNSAAALITSGAASALVLATASAIVSAGWANPDQLPYRDSKSIEVVIPRPRKSDFASLTRLAGAELVHAGDDTACGIRDIVTAINERTVAFLYVDSPSIPPVGPSVSELAAIARDYGRPLIVDAAGSLPPKRNLTHFISEGADLVLYSGGKYVRGPQNTGFMVGRADLVRLAREMSCPNLLLGRPHKVTKEQMVGLYTALRLYVETDEEAMAKEHRRMLIPIVDAFGGYPGLQVELKQDNEKFRVPTVVFYFTEQWQGGSVREICETLLHVGSPPIFCYHDSGGRELYIHPQGLIEGDAELIVSRLRSVLS